MINEFKNYLEQQELSKPDDRILLGVSGGIDSMVMAQLFISGGYNVAVAHCNFSLRGDESDADEAFVKNYAQKKDVAFYCKKFDARVYSEEKKISVQMAVRELRIHWCNSLADELGFDHYATAHHRDDQIETFFINLMRSSGISGLRGMLPKQGKLIHPMLFTGRQEIKKFAVENGIPYREDSSNLKTEYLRNQIRLELIPVLEKIKPGIQSTIIKNMEYLRSVELVYKKQIEKGKANIMEADGNKMIISIEKLKRQPDAVLLLFEIVRDFGFNYSDAERIVSILDAQPGKIFLSGSHRVIKDRDLLIVKPIKDRIDEVFELPESFGTISFPIMLKLKIMERSDEYRIPTEPDHVAFDADRLEYPLKLRKWKKGDLFFPLGMRSKKLISDFFTDQKLSLSQKEETWLLISGEEIAWVVGHRIDERFKITENTTRIAEFFVTYG